MRGHRKHGSAKLPGRTRVSALPAWLVRLFDLRFGSGREDVRPFARGGWNNPDFD